MLAGTLISVAHKLNTFPKEMKKNAEDSEKVIKMSKNICEYIRKAKKADIQILELVKQAIEILEK